VVVAVTDSATAAREVLAVLAVEVTAETPPLATIARRAETVLRGQQTLEEVVGLAEQTQTASPGMQAALESSF
jgi:hypothetical protein